MILISSAVLTVTAKNAVTAKPCNTNRSKIR